MAVRPILVVGNPILRSKAKKVSRFDQSVQRVVDDLIDTMRAAPGVGLAAPQIGVPLQIVVIEVEKDTVHVLVNPQITKSKGEVEVEEGCLSVPGYWATLKRAEKVTVRAKDAKGKEVRVSGDGLLGQALQHELDHLRGIVYVDLLDSLDELRRTDEHPRKSREREPEAAVTA
jgi:peptide deformylase